MEVPTAVKNHNYPMEYRVKDKHGELHMRCECIISITMKMSKEQAKAEVGARGGARLP